MISSFLLVLVLIVVGMVAVDAAAAVDSTSDTTMTSTTTTTTTTLLSNGIALPLLGMGVGNLQHEAIVPMITMGISECNIRLIDTAHASHNEHLIRQAIEESATSSSTEPDGDATTNDIHVITKVWYTHLGYERTIISVKESLRALSSSSNDNHRMRRKINVHVLLHWPRCREDIPWMDCEREEEQLSSDVRNAGPPPHLYKDTAHLESWRALEDMYREQQDQDQHHHEHQSQVRIASIGVSNYDLQDLKILLAHARIPPHVLQGNVWTYVFDPQLVEYLNVHQIHFQAYNVMNGILSHSATTRTSNAYHVLLSVAKDLSSSSDSNNNVVNITPAQVVLRWLTQKGVSVIPRTSSAQHLQENAAAISTVPLLSVQQQTSVESAVAALLRGVDLEPPQVVFSTSQVTHLFWRDEGKQMEVPVKEHFQPEESFVSRTFPGHVFVAYDESKSTRKEYYISAQYGDSQTFHIEL